MADRSQYVMAAWKYLQDAAAEIGNPGLRAAVLDIMKNPAPLLAEGDAKAIMAELKGQGLLAQDAKAVFPTCASTKKSPQPFYTAPGSGWNSHHIYPGGLVTHTALNVASCKALYDNYADMFGLKLDRDVVLASQLLHDLHKPWVFQWQADGTCRKEEPLAATGEHHVLSIAESLRRGLSPELCVAQACAHDHPRRGRVRATGGGLAEGRRHHQRQGSLQGRACGKGRQNPAHAPPYGRLRHPPRRP